MRVSLKGITVSLVAVGFGMAGILNSFAAPIDSPLEKLLKERLRASKKQFGEMRTWQSRVFDEDVVSHPNRFIKDYRSNSAQSVSAEVDDDAIRAFLEFHALPEKADSEESKPSTDKASVPSSRLAWIIAKSDGGCDACAKMLPVVKAGLEAQLVRRGFTTVSVNESKSSAAKAKTGLYTVLSLGFASKDPNDTAHADEVNYEVRLSHFASPGEREISSEIKNAVPEATAVLAKAEQMMIESFVDLGTKMKTQIAAGHADSSAPGIEIRISNIKSDALFGKLVEPLRVQLGATLIKASPGMATFRVEGGKSRDDLIRQIEKIEFFNKKWVIQKTSTEDENVIEAKLQ